MRILYCISALCFAVVNSVWAGVPPSFHTNLVYNIKPTQKVKSKPAYPQYASVSFLQDNTKLDFSKGEIDVKTQCASLGYVISTSKCTGAMKPSKLCSAESSMKSVAGADGFTTGCCNSNLYTALSPDSCTNNSTSLNDFCYYDGSKKYRCSCDRARYPYSSSDNTTCGTGGEFDVSDVCVAPNAQGQNINYYSGCCPNSYQECDAGNHEVGLGKSCRVQSSKGIVTKYESCTCASHYDTVCTDGKLINVDNVCKRNGLNYTTESNCESLCTKTSETNIDDYLYGNVWHCLYENDGATLKETDEELKGKLCRGYATGGTSVGSLIDKALNDCEAQGYVKSEDDCYAQNAMLRCPSDLSKVWCLDGKYCTGYDVGSINGVSACNAGANFTACSLHDQGTRCKYQVDECNKCWNEGYFDGSKCSNLDASSDGNSRKCCKRGYKMVSGLCVANDCASQKDSAGQALYPYVNKNPGEDQGALKVCYQGKAAGGDYDVYYGYESCNSNQAQGGVWKQDETNARKCVCDRKNNLVSPLPFDSSTFFATNRDTSNNYSRVGFGKGAYGEQNSCTDSEGTYYGYSSCYLGRRLGTTDASKGMCLTGGCDGVRSKYAYFYQYNGAINEIIQAETDSLMSSYPNVTQAIADPSKIYCINQYTHCRSRTGEKLGDDSACAMVVDGCLTGVEAACNNCYHTVNVKKGANGLWTAAGNFKVTVLSCNNTDIYLGMESCPKTYHKGGGNYGSCYKYCTLNNLADCNISDVIVDGTVNSNGEASGTKIGIVTEHNRSQKQITIYAYMTGRYGTWDKYMADMKEYAPAGYENHKWFGKGKWTTDPGYPSHCARYNVVGTGAAEGVTIPQDAWRTQEYSDTVAYLFVRCDASVLRNKSGSQLYTFLTTFSY